MKQQSDDCDQYSVQSLEEVYPWNLSAPIHVNV